MAKYSSFSLADQEMEGMAREILNQNAASRANDIYYHGGILDGVDYTGAYRFYTPNVSNRKKLLEDKFVLSDLRFVSAFRLLDAPEEDIDRLIDFLNKWKVIIATSPIVSDGPMRSNPNPWSSVNYIQPQASTLSWPMSLGGESEPNVPDDEDTDKEKEKTPSFLGAYWGDPMPVRGKHVARKNLAGHINAAQKTLDEYINEKNKSVNNEDSNDETTKDDE